jgi:hypothetical protein
MKSELQLRQMLSKFQNQLSITESLKNDCQLTVKNRINSLKSKIKLLQDILDEPISMTGDETLEKCIACENFEYCKQGYLPDCPEGFKLEVEKIK